MMAKQADLLDAAEGIATVLDGQGIGMVVIGAVEAGSCAARIVTVGRGCPCHLAGRSLRARPAVGSRITRAFLAHF
jgi:hypothetical protein